MLPLLGVGFVMLPLGLRGVSLELLPGVPLLLEPESLVPELLPAPLVLEPVPMPVFPEVLLVSELLLLGLDPEPLTPLLPAPLLPTLLLVPVLSSLVFALDLLCFICFDFFLWVGCVPMLFDDVSSELGVTFVPPAEFCALTVPAILKRKIMSGNFFIGNSYKYAEWCLPLTVAKMPKNVCYANSDYSSEHVFHLLSEMLPS